MVSDRTENALSRRRNPKISDWCPKPYLWCVDDEKWSFFFRKLPYICNSWMHPFLLWASVQSYVRWLFNSKFSKSFSLVKILGMSVRVYQRATFVTCTCLRAVELFCENRVRKSSRFCETRNWNYFHKHVNHKSWKNIKNWLKIGLKYEKNRSNHRKLAKNWQKCVKNAENRSTN